MDILSHTKRISATTKLVEKARNDAAAGIPAQTDTALTAAESHLIEEVRCTAHRELNDILPEHADRARETAEKCGDSIRATREQLAGVSLQPPPLPDLNIPEQKLQSAIAYYNLFRTDHGLTRDAEDHSAFLAVALAVTTIVFEGAANSYFFAQASEHGLLGGFFYAIVFSFINVAFAFVGGALGLRSFHHRDAGRKLAGLIAFLLCLTACAVIIVICALYRGELDALADHAQAPDTLLDAAWDSAREQLIALRLSAAFNSIDSSLLLVIGILCAGFGVWEGYRIDDPYPGFGKMLRLSEEAKEEYNEVWKESNRTKEAWMQQTVTRLEQLRSNLQYADSDRRGALGGFERALEQAKNLTAQTVDLAKAVLSEYRNENIRNRAAEKPAYFDRFPDAQEFPGLIERWENRNNEYQGLKKNAAQFESDWRQLADQIRQKIEAAKAI